MEKDTLKIFSQLRTSKLTDTGSYQFEINLGDKRIRKSEPVRHRNRDFDKLQDKLPPSFKTFIHSVSNGLHIGIGNHLTIYPVDPKNNPDFWTNLLSWNNDMIDDTLFPSKEFVFFASTGGGEMFGFYTATKLANGEFPIFWFTPGSADTKPFVLLNSSFDRFLTIQYYLLKATDNAPTYSYEEAQKFSSGEYAEQDANNWQNFHGLLYSVFDPTIIKPNYDYYKSAISFSECIQQIDILKTKSDNNEFGKMPASE